jgi:thiamine pyrophosphokinase
LQSEADSAQPVPREGKAIVVGNGRCPDPERLPPATLDGARLVIAADGGVRSALLLGLTPDGVVGDGDSLRPADRAAVAELRIRFDQVSAEKDESDLELAVRHVLSEGVAEIVIVGAVDGPRIEHTVANLLLLAWPELAEVSVTLVDDRSSIRALRAADEPRTLTLAGQPSDFVSLLAVGGDVREVTTAGLKYPLARERLLLGTSRGLSNELVASSASVTVRGGAVLVVHTPRRNVEQEAPDGAV